MKALKSILIASFTLLILLSLSYQPGNAVAVYIQDFSDFPAYPYNTDAYSYVGCGPTTGAMIFGYFDHVHSSTLLTSPVSGVNEGLQTGWVLHGSSYMNTNSNGFGSPYNIEPGLENYGDDRGYRIRATIHASPTYDPNSPAADWLNDYGDYGDSWLNDGYFWRTDGTNWWIDVNDFCNLVDSKISVGIAIFLTIDTNSDRGGDHWVPLVGYDRATQKYAYYDTYSTTLRWADIHYCDAPGPTINYGIAMLRSVAYEGPISPQLNPPSDLVALSGYHTAIPLAWNAPEGTLRAVAATEKYTEIHPPLPVYGQLEQLPINFQMSSILSNTNYQMPGEGNSSELSFDPQAFLGYNVYRSTSAGGSYSKIASNITRQYYRDGTASNGQQYYYKVTAVYNEGESDPSNLATGTAQLNGYSIPSGWASTPPTLNGVINASEWAAATQTNVTFPGLTGTVTLYAMNDNNKLYLAMDDARDIERNHLDQFALFFDENKNREWPSSAPSGEGIIWIAWDSTANSSFTLFGGRYGYWPYNIGLEAQVTAPGVGQNISISSGHIQYEGSYDFASSPVNTSAGSTIGILVFTYDYYYRYFNSFWPQAVVSLGAITYSIYGWGTAPFSYGDLKLAISASVPDISVTPSSWDYGSVNVGSQADKTFVVRNDGAATLNVTSVDLTGDISQFSIVSGGGAISLAPGATNNLIVRFKPTSSGSKSVTVRIYSNDPNENPFSVNLTGTVTVVNPPVLSVSPTTLNFGTTTNSLTFQISNTGGGTLSWTVAENPDKAWITSITPSSGTNNATVTVNVNRSAVSGSSDTGTLAVTSNGGNQNITVTIEKAPVLTVNPTTLNFGTTTNSLTFQINNTGGGTLIWTVVENPDKAWITSITPSSGTNNATVTVNVNRSAVSGASDTGTLTISSNGGNQNITVTIAKQAVLPSHWTYTDNTGQTANVVLPTSANPNIDGVPLPNGDFVGVFTPAGLCCGNAEWQGANLSITVWGDNDQTPATDGFKSNELIKYRVYRPSIAKEWDVVQVGYSQGTGNYSTNAFMVLNKFDVSDEVCMTLDFASGWNMFSLNVTPANPNISAVMASVASKLVIAKNNSGKSYIPMYSINDIGSINYNEGYQAYFNQAAQLEVCGMPISPTTPINLPAGWSMISYLPTTPINAATALASINSKIVIVKNNQGKSYIPMYGINDIGNMLPGQGYQIYLNAAGTLVYPASALAKDDPIAELKSTEHFTFTARTGENAVVVIPADIQPHYSDGTLLEIDDEIGVFTSNGICCGAVVWDGTNTAITIWGDDQQSNLKDGFTAGDSYKYRVWKKATDKVYAVTVSYQNAEGNYAADDFAVLDKFVVDMTKDAANAGFAVVPTEFKLLQNYPNPFNPDTYIGYQLADKSSVKLSVFSLQGQLIRILVDMQQEAGTYSAYWNGHDQLGDKVPSGVYLYRLETNDAVFARKMIMIK